MRGPPRGCRAPSSQGALPNALLTTPEMSPPAGPPLLLRDGQAALRCVYPGYNGCHLLTQQLSESEISSCRRQQLPPAHEASSGSASNSDPRG